jgi:DNA-binding NarL/FixJ family response regulator
MVILADNSKPETSPLIRKQVEELREAHPGVPMMVLLQLTDRKLMRELVKVGVSGVILGSVPEQVTVAAIRLVMAGGSFAPAEFLLDVDEPTEPAKAPPAVTPPADLPAQATRFTLRERDILDRLRRGMQNKIIAHELGISESTVKVHLRNIMKKMHARNRTQVVFLLGEQT